MWRRSRAELNLAFGRFALDYGPDVEAGVFYKAWSWATPDEMTGFIQDMTIQEAMMKFSVSKLMRWVAILMMLLSAGAPATTVASRESAVTSMSAAEPESAVQRILIKVQPGLKAPTGRLAYAAPTALSRAMMAQGVTAAQPLFHAEPETPSTTGLERIYHLELAAEADINKAVAALNANPNIEWAEPDYIARATVAPNDPLYAEQWGVAKIDAPAAWDVVTGTPAIVIAIIDSGIDLTHPDLQANLWVNPAEVPGNGIDEDSNGYVDDVRGWNFVNGTNNVSDGGGHGTQVAGVAAAVTNNALGIAGVCWNCKIMPVRVMADSGISNYSDIALGVKYAADKGAHVINLSLGGYAYSNALRDAINYAVNDNNVVVVAGAGNDNVSTPFYPAAYDNVIAVAGTTDVDTKADFSDYGAWVDVSAPAVDIMTTYLGGDWGLANGTSLAAPFVAGVAALIRSQHPEWNATMVRNQILQTADPIDTLNPSYAGQLGFGRDNAAQAMQAPRPAIALAGISVNGDPLGRPIPGESATVAITLRNDWWDADGVTGVLSTTDPYVTFNQATASYGDLASGATGTSSPIYAFTIASGAGYNHPIPFTLTVNADDGAYSVTHTFTVTTRSGEELVCGSILQDTVWTSDKTYIATCNIGIAPGVTLTIQPGTEVRFNDTYGLNVGGTLLADGTADQPIRMVANGANGWRGIRFDDASVDAQADTEGQYWSGNLLRYVEIEGSTFGINVLSATPYLAHLDLDATTVVSQSISGSLGATPLWLMDSVISGGETAVVLTGAVNAHRNVIAGVGVIVSTGPVTISSNVFSGGGVEVNNGGTGTISDNVITGGGIYIVGVSIIRQNIVQDGSITAWNTTTMLSNTVRGGGIIVGENSEVRGNDVSGASEWGITGFPGTILLADGATNIRAIDNRIVGNQNGIAVASGLVQGNLIANNAEVGLALGEATVISNTLTGNRGAAVKVSWSQLLTFAGNNLEGNLGQYDFENTTAAIDARNNWWGTTNTALIQQRIFDGNDDHNFGIVLFDPMLTAPNATAPAYIRAVTLTPESPVGIQTVTFDVLFSREMDAEVAPVLSFVTPERGWSTYTPMPTARTRLAVAAASNGKLYALGGTNDTGPLAEVEEYDPVTNRWTTRAPMPTARYGSGAAAASNGKLYVIGGYNNGPLATVEEYDPATDTWTVRAPMPTPRYGLAVAAAPNGKLYAVGGSSNDVLAVVEEYDPTANKWTTRASMPTARAELGLAAAPDGKLYAVGGFDTFLHFQGVATVEESNPSVNIWRARAPMPTGLYGLSMVTAPNGRLYAIGGTLTTTIVAPVQEYNPLADSWMTREDMPTARSGLAAAAANNGQLFAIGGHSQNLGYLATVEAYAPWAVNTDFATVGWLTPDLYRVTYDFNALIPPGTYSLTIAGAYGFGSMEIAPHDATAFTVAYAGAIADTTPPPAPVVTACAAETPDALSAEWSAKDPDSAITLYQYAIGTKFGGIEVVNWTNTAETSIDRSLLTLLAGQTYYISVKARNEGGLWSAPSSVGVVAGSGGCVSNVTQWNIYLPLVLRN